MTSNTEETKEERRSRRTREEQEAKRKARRSPGGSSHSTSKSSVASRTAKRAEEEQEAKRRAKDSGRRSTRTSTSTHTSRSSRRTETDEEIKRRARGSVSSSRRENEDRDAKRRARGSRSANSMASPGAYSGSTSSSDRINRKSSRHRGSSRGSRSSTRSDEDRVAKRRAREGRRPTSTPGASSAITPPPIGSPEPSPTVDESGTVQLEALAVDDAIEDARMMKLEEANKQLQEQMQNMARVQRGEAPLNGGNTLAVPAGTAVEADEEDEEDGDEEDQGKSNKKRNIWIVIIILLLAGGGAAAAVALGGSSEAPVSAPTTPTDTATDPVVSDPTDAPVATESPSDSPTRALSVFEPPKPDDCTAMSEGNSVSDQDDLVERNFTVALNIVVTEATDLQTLQSRLMSSLQEVLVPILAGCETASRRKMRDGSHRILDIDPYAIGNADVGVTCELSSSCAGTSTVGTCYECLMAIGVDLKDETVKDIELIGKIGNALNEETLIKDLGLEDLVSDLNALGVSKGIPTNAPSHTPSLAPSGAPSGEPSKQPTIMPSSKPTFMPVAAPTTEAPTKAPTQNPTKRPTPQPTQSPTKRPTPGPTESPTKRPTPAPTPPPTNPPTPPPTNPPTAAPVQPTPAPVSPPTPAPVNPGCPAVEGYFSHNSYQVQSAHSSSLTYSLGCNPNEGELYALVIDSTSGCATCAGYMIPPDYAGACITTNFQGSATWQLTTATEGATVYYGFATISGWETLGIQTCPNQPMSYTGPPADDDQWNDDGALRPGGNPP